MSCRVNALSNSSFAAGPNSSSYAFAASAPFRAAVCATSAVFSAASWVAAAPNYSASASWSSVAEPTPRTSRSDSLSASTFGIRP